MVKYYPVHSYSALWKSHKLSGRIIWLRNYLRVTWSKIRMMLSSSTVISSCWKSCQWQLSYSTSFEWRPWKNKKKNLYCIISSRKLWSFNVCWCYTFNWIEFGDRKDEIFCKLCWHFAVGGEDASIKQDLSTGNQYRMWAEWKFYIAEKYLWFLLKLEEGSLFWAW